MISGRLIKDAALLLTNSAVWPLCDVPSDWNGCILSTKTILDKLKTDTSFVTNYQSCELTENSELIVYLNNASTDPTKITIIHNAAAHDANDDNVIFLIQDDIMTTLLLGIHHRSALLPTDLIITNSIFRRAVADGIDRVLIDDTLFLTDCMSRTASINATTESRSHEYNLTALLYTIQPRTVISLSGMKLPASFSLYCKEIDYYKDAEIGNNR